MMDVVTLCMELLNGPITVREVAWNVVLAHVHIAERHFTHTIWEFEIDIIIAQEKRFKVLQLANLSDNFRLENIVTQVNELQRCQLHKALWNSVNQSIVRKGDSDDILFSVARDSVPVAKVDILRKPPIVPRPRIFSSCDFVKLY